MNKIPLSGYQLPAWVAGLTFIVDWTVRVEAPCELVRLEARETDPMSAELEAIATRLITIHAGCETEQNWEKIENGIKSFVEASMRCNDNDAIVHTVRKSVEVFLTAVKDYALIF